ncbi:ferric iron reductase FhuF-like transporter family protein [Actinoalloteichus sp. AHMU CJ021]|uniref:Ferric iron reductase FhuF-like transporter n=2 Tax=Actinoalloteichus cyanogriseus TaxID=2893586 RepID=A0ABT1JGL7_ACTCY|nr:(2Fe-2S)-binding protein [Actinoalloteichus caeruleus]AUS77705.1 ferric iron reductase FhuF-like transporter family protein [Actinoalloteichus sp. AHMU CJ021]MCP2331627.1 Ferric iron reductase FhuF-like transporter [Actinoalloteichus caeruleus DSM 43889]
MPTDLAGPVRGLLDACAPLTFAPLPAFGSAPTPGPDDAPEPARRWFSAEEFAAGEVRAVFDALRADGNLPPQVQPAAMRYMRSLFRELVFVVSAGVYLTGRAVELRPDGVWFPVLADGATGTPLVAAPRVAVLPGGAPAGHPDVAAVVPDEDALDRFAAAGLVATCGPVIEDLARHTRVGVRTLWGYVIDCLHFYMLNPARRLGRDMTGAWARASRLAAAVIEAGAPRRAMPRMIDFPPTVCEGLWAVRGTCCFDYKADADHGYCVTCPLERDELRRPRLAVAFGS